MVGSPRMPPWQGLADVGPCSLFVVGCREESLGWRGGIRAHCLDDRVASVFQVDPGQRRCWSTEKVKILAVPAARVPCIVIFFQVIKSLGSPGK